MNHLASSLLVLACVTACGSTAAPATTPATPAPAMATTAPAMAAPTTAPAMTTPAPAPAGPTLNDTPAAKLGSAPAGFGLPVGSAAPDAALTDVSGTSRQLAAMYREGPTFVVFYRGGWCPFCNLQLHNLAAAKPQFDQRGVHVVAISVDQPGEEAKTQAKQGVPFPMLSDSDLTAHRAFHVVHTPSDAEAHALTSYGVDLEKYSGKPHHTFAVPAIFLIDRAGKIRWVHVDEDFKTRPSPAQMLEVAGAVLAH